MVGKFWRKIVSWKCENLCSLAILNDFLILTFHKKKLFSLFAENFPHFFFFLLIFPFRKSQSDYLLRAFLIFFFMKIYYSCNKINLNVCCYQLFMLAVLFTHNFSLFLPLTFITIIMGHTINCVWKITLNSSRHVTFSFNPLIIFNFSSSRWGQTFTH